MGRGLPNAAAAARCSHGQILDLMKQRSAALGNELQLCRRIENAASRSGQSGKVEIRDVESLKGAANKIGVNTRGEGLSVAADIGE